VVGVGSTLDSIYCDYGWIVNMDSCNDIHKKMKTRVVNLNIEKYDVYIGRGSIWGNPFIIGKHGNRKSSWLFL